MGGNVTGKTFEEQIIAQFSQGVIGFDANFNVVYVNDHVKQKTGLGEKQFKTWTFEQLFEAEALETCKKSLQAGNAVHSILKFSAGALNHPFEVSLKPVMDGVKVAGYFATADLEKPLISEHTFPDIKALTEAYAQSRESILITDADLDYPGPRILYVNPAFTYITGYAREEVIGKSPRILQGPNTDKSILQKLRETLVDDGQFSGEVINYRKDGTEFIMQWEISALRNQAGEVTHYISVQRDVTEQRKAEKGWKESEKRHSEFLAKASVGICVHVDRQIVFANPKAAELLGYDSPEKLKGKDIVSFIREERKQKVKERIEYFRKTQGQVPPEEEVFVKKDGNEIYLEVFGIPCEYRGEDAIEVILTDITERKEAERKLRQQEEYFRMISENSLDFIALHNPDGTFTYASPSIKELLGIKPEDLYGDSPYPYIHPDDQEYLGKLHQQVLEGKFINKARYRAKHADGHYIWIEAHLNPVYNDRGELFQIQTVSRDVTEEHQLKSLLEETQEIASIGGWSYFLDDDRFFFSKKIFDLYGINESETIDKEKAISYYDPEHQPVIRKAFDELVEHGKPFDKVLKFWQGQRQFLWVRAIGRPYYEKGRLYRVGGTLQDITEKQETEQRLKESEAKFRTFAERSLVGVYLFNAEKVEYVNPKIAEISGYSLDELYENVSPRDLVHPEDRPVFDERMRRRMEGEKESENYEFRLVTKSGEIKHVEVFGTLIEWKNQQAIMGTLLDKTESKEAERKLLENQYFTRKVMDHSPILIHVYDYETFKFVYTSQPIEENLGYSAEEINQMENSVADLMHPDDLPHVYEAYESNLKLKDGEVNEVQFRMKNKKGEWRWMLSRDTPFRRDEKGCLRQILSTVEDITGQKQKEQEILENQKFIESVARHTPHIINIYDREDDEVIYQNRNIIDLLGYSKEEVASLKNGLKDLYHPDDLQRVIDYTHKSLSASDGDVKSIEFRLRHKDGHWLWFYNKDIVFKRNSDGEITQFLGVIQDVTDQKIKEQEILEKQLFIESVTKHTPHIINIYDADKEQVIFENRSILEFLGYNAAERKSLNRKLQSLYHPEDVKRIQEHEKKAFQLSDEEELSIEVRLLHKNGHWAWFLNKDIVFKRKPNGEIKQFLGVVQDITEHKHAWEALERSEAQLRQLFHNAPVGIVMLDNDGFIKSCNQGFTNIFGYRLEEIKNNIRLNELIAPDSHINEANEITNKTMLGKRVYKESVRKDVHGNLRHVLIYGVPVFYEGKPINIFGIYVDITDRKKAEDELKIQTEELQKINAELEQFAYVTSHNLRSPVVNLRGLLDLFDQSELQDEQNRYVFEKMSQSVDQLSDTLNDLINIVSSKKELSQPREKVQFKEILDKVERSVYKQITEAEANIESDFSGAPDIYYIKSFIESILLNLLTNAVKYRSVKCKPVIQLKTTECEDGFICLKISDNGSGIDLDKYGDRLFNLYQQFHGNTAGKGMGLYLVKTQVESLGGRIEVDSSVGKGTTFKLYLKDHRDN